MQRPKANEIKSDKWLCTKIYLKAKFKSEPKFVVFSQRLTITVEVVEIYVILGIHLSLTEFLNNRNKLRRNGRF